MENVPPTVDGKRVPVPRVVPKRTIKPLDGESASVVGGEMRATKRPMGENNMVVAEAGAGNKVARSGVPKAATRSGAENKAAGSGIDTAATEVKAKPAGTRMKKLVMVKQEYIDCLLKEPAPKVFDGVPKKIMKNLPDDLREQLRFAQADTRAYMLKLVDKDKDILEQFRTKGYAMEWIEIGDDEVDVEAEN